MTNWTPSTLVHVDDKEDRERASDGYSRYGAYLAQHLDRFHEWDEPETPLGPEWFAVVAWEIANSPTMAPGYVDVRDDLGAVRFEVDQDEGELVARISVPMRHSAFAARLPYRWRDWDTENRMGGDEAYPMHVPPRVSSPVSVLASAEVSVAAKGWRLHTPSHTHGRGLVDDAKEAVRVLAEQLNEHAGPVVATLHGEAVNGR